MFLARLSRHDSISFKNSLSTSAVPRLPLEDIIYLSKLPFKTDSFDKMSYISSNFFDVLLECIIGDTPRGNVVIGIRFYPAIVNHEFFEISKN